MKTSTAIFFALAVPLAAFLVTPAAFAGTPIPTGMTMTTGKMRSSGSATYQPVTVKNATDQSFKLVKVDCGFFKGDELTATDYGLVENLMAGQTGYGSVVTLTSARFDRAECRLVEARPLTRD